MYDKVSTNLNFVEREVEVQKIWKENNIFEKAMLPERVVLFLLFMMALQQQTVSHTLVILLHVP